MTTFLWVLLFIAIGALIGYLGSRLFTGASLVVSLLLGVIGSLGISWVGKLLGLGAGFTAFSWWGLILAIAGAALATAIYGFIARRSENKATSRT